MSLSESNPLNAIHTMLNLINCTFLTSFIHLLFIESQSPIYSSLSRDPSEISKFIGIHRQRSGFLQQIAKQILIRILKPSVPIHVLNFKTQDEFFTNNSNSERHDYRIHTKWRQNSYLVEKESYTVHQN